MLKDLCEKLREKGHLVDFNDRQMNLSIGSAYHVLTVVDDGENIEVKSTKNKTRLAYFAITRPNCFDIIINYMEQLA